jgi:hypothetical protein
MKIADALHIELSEIFNYSPEKSPKEMRKMIADLMKGSDKKQLKLFAEIAKAIFMS